MLLGDSETSVYVRLTRKLSAFARENTKSERVVLSAIPPPTSSRSRRLSKQRQPNYLYRLFGINHAFQSREQCEQYEYVLTRRITLFPLDNRFCIGKNFCGPSMRKRQSIHVHFVSVIRSSWNSNQRAW